MPAGLELKGEGYYLLELYRPQAGNFFFHFFFSPGHQMSSLMYSDPAHYNYLSNKGICKSALTVWRYLHAMKKTPLAFQVAWEKEVSDKTC